MFEQQISRINSQRQQNQNGQGKINSQRQQNQNGQGKTGVMYEMKDQKFYTGDTAYHCYSGSYKPGNQETAHRKLHKDINEQRPQQCQ